MEKEMDVSKALNDKKYNIMVMLSFKKVYIPGGEIVMYIVIVWCIKATFPQVHRILN
jgi:hypothetical protein